MAEQLGVRPRGGARPAAPRRCTWRCGVLGVRPGDTVLVPILTFAATANAVVYLGRHAGLPRQHAGSWNVDPDLVAEELRPAGRATAGCPAAVIAVDLYGQCADYDPIARRPATATACRSSRTPPRRSARPTAAGPAGTFGELRRALVQRQQDHHHQRRRHAGHRRRAELAARARHLATQAREPVPHYEHRTSATTTGSATCWPRSAAASCSGLDERDRRPPGDQPAATGRRWPTCPASSSCRSPTTASPTAGSPACWSTPPRSARPRRSPRHLERARHRGPAGLEADAPAAGVPPTA